MTVTRAGEPPAGSRSQWYHQPVAWVGVLLFLASLAGCVWLLVASLRYDERALPGTGEQLLKMPLERVPGADAQQFSGPQLSGEEPAAQGSDLEAAGLRGGSGPEGGSGRGDP